MRWLTGLALGLLGCALAVPAARGQGGTVSSSYMQTFDGMPATPAAYRPPGWDVQIHSRDEPTWTELEPMVADHGPACEGPPAQHALGGDYPSHVFQCHDHVMTSIQANGYGVIYLTPPALADFSRGETVIRWDMSTRRTAIRDWVDVWVSPVADHLALPLTEGYPDLAGPPRNAVHAQMSVFGTANGPWTSIGAAVVRDFQEVNLPNSQVGYETVLTPDAARRDTFELRLSRTHVTIGMPAYNLWWTDEAVPDLGWDQGVVQLGHHSYFPSKDCEPTATLSCSSGTWHWDNVSISPSVPISITSLLPRQLSDQAPGGWIFPAPAPADTRLQLAAVNAPVPSDGTPCCPSQLDLSWDGGTTWATVVPQPVLPALQTAAKARSYWVPVPAGATRVDVRGQGSFWGGAWRATDASLWQLPRPDLPPTPVPPSPLPTLPPGVTATPIPPFATLTPEATLPPLPTATIGVSPTAVPTSTPLPRATATPARYPLPDATRPCQVSHAAFGTPGATPWVNVPASQCH